jgi:hypothetical protein
MAFTRQFDDPCMTKMHANGNANIFSHVMDTNKHYNCNPCYIDRIPAGNTTSLTSNNIVDLESELSGRTRAATKCPSGRYLPGTVIQGKGIARKPKSDKTGLPCGDMHKDGLVHLPRCSMVDYPKRPASVGYKLDYPKPSLWSRLTSSVRPNLFVPIEYQGKHARY